MARREAYTEREGRVVDIWKRHGGSKRVKGGPIRVGSGGGRVEYR